MVWMAKFVFRWHGNSFFHCSPYAIFSLCSSNNLQLEDFWLGPESLNDLICSSTIYKVNFINKFLLHLSDKIFIFLRNKDKLFRKKILTSKSFGFVASKTDEVTRNFDHTELYNRSMS